MKSTPSLTIPELRKAFEYIEEFVQTEKGKDVNEFRKTWKKIFGKDVSREAAEEYLAFVKKEHTAQHGGAAPLDYQMRPGLELPYGSYPSYVGSGFGFANQDSLTAQSGKEGSLWPMPPAGLGSNLVGGKRKSKSKTRKQKGGMPSLATVVSEAMQRPFVGAIPPSTGQVTQMSLKGFDLPTGDPVKNPNLSELATSTTFRAVVN